MGQLFPITKWGKIITKWGSSKITKWGKKITKWGNTIFISRIQFQKKIKKDIQLIKSSDKRVTFADKTTNLYRLTKGEYDHMINNAMTLTYKKASNNIKKNRSMLMENKS